MQNFSILHQTNIIIHIIAGSVALLTGSVTLFLKKGTQLHRRLGRIFLALLGVVVLTGLIGVFVFGRNTFLAVITVLSGYLGYSGYRNIQNKSNNPHLVDSMIALVSLTVVIYFLYYLKSIGLIWSPLIIYSTVGYLILIISYDLLRYLIPKASYSNLWLYEHILKMISAFSGLLSAFSGTVFPDYRPYSQFLPSVLGSLIAIGFIIKWYRFKNKRPAHTLFNDDLLSP